MSEEGKKLYLIFPNGNKVECKPVSIPVFNPEEYTYDGIEIIDGEKRYRFHQMSKRIWIGNLFLDDFDMDSLPIGSKVIIKYSTAK